MIMDGDQLCLGLSGGKDSMTLLHVLLDLKKKAPIRCAHILASLCAKQQTVRGHTTKAYLNHPTWLLFRPSPGFIET